MTHWGKRGRPPVGKAPPSEAEQRRLMLAADERKIRYNRTYGRLHNADRRRRRAVRGLVVVLVLLGLVVLGVLVWRALGI